MIKQDFTVGDQAELDIHIHSGRVEVREGPPGAVSVEVDTDDSNFTVEKRGDVIYVASDQSGGWSLGTRQAHVTVTAPPGTDLTVGTASARVALEAELGRVDVKTASGDVDIERARSATVKTASGDVKIGSVDEDVRVSSASGDVSCDSCGRAVFSTASGDVSLGESSDAVTASTASGDVRIDRFQGRRVSVKSMSGEASIGIPAGTQVDLDATTLSGRLNLPEPSPDTPPSERRMSVKAKLVSGDLTLRRV